MSSIFENNETTRLDKHIKRTYGKNVKQSTIEKALRDKDILVNDKKATAGQRVTPSDVIFIHPNILKIFENTVVVKDNSEALKNSQQFVDEFKSLILYEDDDFIIVNKPSGLAVQAGSKIKNSLDFIAMAYNNEARLVHRIDKDTSGITIFAKNLKTSAYMLDLFKNQKVNKNYIAITEGIPSVRDGIINAPLLKIHSKVIVNDQKGKPAVTEYQVTQKLGNNRCIILATPKTGRTHQIRVHFASCLECPIIGDPKYGFHNKKKSEHLYLHSFEVTFENWNRKKIYVRAEMPQYMLDEIAR